jgi:hypothetical protein
LYFFIVIGFGFLVVTFLIIWKFLNSAITQLSYCYIFMFVI